MFLVLNIVADIQTGWSCLIVIVMAFTAILYIIRGRLKTGAFTDDAMQSIIMLVASVVLWAIVWVNVGGWSGLNQKLATIDADLPQTLLHVGGYSHQRPYLHT